MSFSFLVLILFASLCNSSYFSNSQNDRRSRRSNREPTQDFSRTWSAIEERLASLGLDGESHTYQSPYARQEVSRSSSDRERGSPTWADQISDHFFSGYGYGNYESIDQPPPPSMPALSEDDASGYATPVSTVDRLTLSPDISPPRRDWTTFKELLDRDDSNRPDPWSRSVSTIPASRHSSRPSSRLLHHERLRREAPPSLSLASSSRRVSEAGALIENSFVDPRPQPSAPLMLEESPSTKTSSLSNNTIRTELWHPMYHSRQGSNYGAGASSSAHRVPSPATTPSQHQQSSSEYSELPTPIRRYFSSIPSRPPTEVSASSSRRTNFGVPEPNWHEPLGDDEKADIYSNLSQHQSGIEKFSHDIINRFGNRAVGEAMMSPDYSLQSEAFKHLKRQRKKWVRSLSRRS